MRLFVAIETGAGGTASPEHLTLAFLGEVADDRVPAISAALAAAAAAVAPFSFVLEGVGAFPDPARPRVVWVGVGAGRERVDALAARVRSALSGLGLAPDPERFHPHRTLFRVRTPDDRRRARALLDGNLPPPVPTTVAVREVLLKASELTARGAIHRTVAGLPLGGGNAT